MKTDKPKTGGRAKTRVLVIDDHPIIRKGLTELIDAESDMEVCGQAEDTVAGLQAVATLSPDVAVVDLSLRHGDGLDLIRDIRAQFPDLPVLVLSMRDESLYAERALGAGAQGYIMKEAATTNVVGALRTVLAGQVYLSSKMSARLLGKFVGGRTDDAPPLAKLSNRELQVFERIGRGQGTRDIAEALHLSVKTIETYRANIKEKLQLTGAAELVQHAVQWFQRE